MLFSGGRALYAYQAEELGNLMPKAPKIPSAEKLAQDAQKRAAAAVQGKVDAAMAAQGALPGSPAAVEPDKSPDRAGVAARAKARQKAREKAAAAAVVDTPAGLKSTNWKLIGGVAAALVAAAAGVMFLRSRRSPAAA